MANEKREVKTTLSAEVPQQTIAAIDKLSAAWNRAAAAQAAMQGGGRSGWSLPGGGHAMPGGGGITYSGGQGTGINRGSLGSAVGGFAPAGPPAPPTPGQIAAQQAAAHQSRLQQLMTTANNLQLGGVAGRIGQFQAAGQGLTGIGATRLGGAVTKFAGRGGAVLGGMEAAASGLEKTTGMIAAFNDPYSTNAQIGRSIVRNFVPMGDKIQGTLDNLTGRAAGFERLGEQAQMAQARIGLEGRQTAFEQQFNPAQAGRRETAAQFAGGSAVASQYVNRTALGGEMEFRNQSRLLQVKKDIQKADRESAATGRERQAAEVGLADATRKELELKKVRNQLERQLNGPNAPQSGVERAELIQKVQNANERVIQATESRVSAAGITSGAVNQDAAAKAAAAKAKAGTFGVAAAALEDRADANQSAARMFGGSTSQQRALSKIGLDILRANGGNRDLLPDDIAGATEGAYPEEARRLYQENAEKNPEYRQYQSDRGLKAGDRVEDLRERANDLRNKQGEAEYSADAGFAKEAETAGAKLAEINIRMFQTMITAYDTKIRSDILASKATQ